MKYLKQAQDLVLIYEMGTSLVLNSRLNDDPDKGKSTCSMLVRLAGSIAASISFEKQRCLKNTQNPQKEYLKV